MQDSRYWQSWTAKRLSRRRVIGSAVVGLGGVAAAAVIGCEDDEEPSTGSPAGSPVVAQQTRGGTQTWALEGAESQPHLDVHRNSFAGLIDAGPAIAYSRVLSLDVTKYPGALVPIGDLAENYENPEQLVFTFKLRRGAKFQNITPVSGRELVARDVIYSFERMRAEGVSAQLLAAVEMMDAPDDYTVRLRLKQPDADFIYNIADIKAKIVPHESVEVNGNLEKGPIIGSGPWIFEEWIPEQLVRMRRNPDYYFSQLPYTDQWTRPVIPDPQTAQAAFRTGQILGVGTDGQITRLLRQTVPDLEIQDSKLLVLVSSAKLWVAPGQGPAKDVRVRQAISKALDRETYIRDVAFGSGWWTVGVFMPGQDWHLPEDELKRLLARDLQGARQLLSAAGVNLADWKPVMDYGVPTPANTAAAELTVSQLKEIGLNVGPLRAADRTELTERIYARGETEIAWGSHPAAAPTNDALFTFHHSKGRWAGIAKQLADPQLEGMIDRQSTMAGDTEGRKALLKDIQRRIVELAYMVPVYGPNGELAVSPKVQGFKNMRLFEDQRWRHVSLKS